MFDWNDLKFFLELARQGRLSAAAKRLKVDNATVSRRIADLERALDARLFDRANTGFTLTAAGQDLLARAEAIEAQTLSLACGLPKGAKAAGPVRVTMMEGIGSQFIARRIPALAARAPDLLLELVTSAALTNLTLREADVSLSFAPLRGPKLTTRAIGEFSLFLYASPSYLARCGAPADRTELRDHSFVDYIDDLILIPEVNWLADIIDAPRVVFRSNSMIAQQSAAAEGVGLALLPTFAAEIDHRLTPVLKPMLRTTRQIYLTVHQDLVCVPRIRETMRFLEEAVAAERDFLLHGAAGASPAPRPTPAARRTPGDAIVSPPPRRDAALMARHRPTTQ